MAEATATPARRGLPPVLYLSLLLCAPVLYDVAITLSFGRGTVLGFAPAALLLLVLMAGALVTGVLSRGDGRWGALPSVWFAAVIVLWVYLVIVERLLGTGTELAAAFVPLAVLLLWLRRPTPSEAWRAADILAWTVVGAAALTLVLEWTGVIPSWYEVLAQSSDRFLTLSEFDRETHWLPLGSLFDLEGRWGGFMNDPNLVAPLGALLVVFAFSRKGARRLVFAAAGVAMVVLADSRATYAAVALGLLILLLLPGWGVRLRTVTVPKVAAVVVGGAAAARLVVDIVEKPSSTLTMTGRTGMWPDFLGLWHEAPIFGVGTPRIAEAVAQGTLPPWAFHGHDQHVDMLVRYGLVGLILSLVVFGVAAAIAIVGARRGQGMGVAVLSALLVTTVANLALDWRYPSPALSALLVVVVVSATATRVPAPAT